MERNTKYRGHLKKLLFSTILLLLWNGGVNAQTSDASLYIKYNISYSIATYWNQSFGLEIPIKNKISLQTMFALGTPLLTLEYHPKQSFCIRMTPELRYYVAKKK
ncbi:MAG: hypothetical protein MUE33_09935 [Cytophagaceae bacterium]|jgi:hypothetical protein|nr:hypothetical protein [Cytophagaceae bacterium]